jgi:hypothetical protein
LRETAKTPEGGFLGLVFMIRDYKAKCSRSALKEYKTDTTPVVVSLKGLREAHCRGRRGEAKKQLTSPPVALQLPRDSARRKKVAEPPSSNKCLGNHLGAKKENKGGQSVAMSQRLHGPYKAAMPSCSSLLANLLLAPVVGRSDIGFRPPQATPSGSHAWTPTVLFKTLSLHLFQTWPFKKG